MARDMVVVVTDDYRGHSDVVYQFGVSRNLADRAVHVLVVRLCSL